MRTEPERRPTPMLPLLALIALASPAVAQAAADPKPPSLEVEAYRLPNGLKVALQRDASVPRVTVAVAYHVGSKNESAGRTGFAHFFEHMMFRGTQHVPNYDIPLQEAGASSNAFTSEDMTVYFETVPSNYLERALYLEAERLAFLPTALDQSKFDTEREVVKNERRQSVDNVPYGLAGEAIGTALYPKGHPYSWSVIGSMGDLGAATLEDLRRFFAEFYHPANATLCLVGDFDPAEAKRLIERYFGPLATGPEPAPVAAPPCPPVSKRLELADRVTAPRVYWAWPTVADDHPDAPALDLLATILAGGQASRLETALVRDARIATEVGADSSTKEIAGEFLIEATAAEGHTPAELEVALTAAVDRIRKEPPSADELERALAKFEKSTFASLTAPLMRAIVLSVGYAQENDPNHYRRDFLRYFQVTPADIRRVAERYLVPEKVALLVRPAGEGESKTTVPLTGPNPSDAPAPRLAARTPAAGPEWSKMPGPSDPEPFQPPPFVRKRLSNGLDVWVAPWKTLPLVNARLIVPAGSADDPEGKAGLATLTATMFDQGTAKRSALELAEALEQLGVTLGVGGSNDSTDIGFSVVTRNLKPTLELVAEVLTEPRFDPADFERERDLQLAELDRGPDSPGWIAQRAFRALLFGQGHPYGNPADGTPESVKALTVEDVRAFHKARFAPKGSTLIVVGDVEPDALMADLEATLGRWKAEGSPATDRPEHASRAKPGVVYLVDKPGAVQSVVAVGRRWVDRSDPSYFPTLVGNRILGGDFLSRLNQNLRERNGYSYGAGSRFGFRRKGSVWSVNTSVRADATAPALREIVNELDGIVQGKPFKAEELEIALGAEVRGYPETFESPSGIAGILEEMAQFGLPPDYLSTFLDQLQKSAPEQIQASMARVVDPAERIILVVGDRKAIEADLKAQGFDRIELITPDGTPAAR